MEYFVLIAAVVVFVIFIKKSNKGPSASSSDFDSLKPEPALKTAAPSQSEPSTKSETVVEAAPQSVPTPAPAKEEAPVEAVAKADRELTDVAGITARIAANLNAEGITSIAHLKRLSKKELLDIKGVGKVTVDKILADI